jgi:hypothetical protein
MERVLVGAPSWRLWALLICLPFLLLAWFFGYDYCGLDEMTGAIVGILGWGESWLLVVEDRRPGNSF